MRIRSERDIVVFVISVTVIAVVSTIAGQYIIQSPEVRYPAAMGGAFLAVVISIPITIYIGRKFLRMTQLYEERERLINYDRLTDTLTREGFFNRIAKAEDMAGLTLMIDLDHFKKINDKFGHFIGDRVLQHVARCILDVVRPGDMVARFGGEEFIVFPDNGAGGDAMAMAERIRDYVARSPIEIDGNPITATISIGASQLLNPNHLDDALRRADDALYEAKRAGRNALVLDPQSLPVAVTERRTGTN